MKGKPLNWITDNQNCFKIIESGGMKTDLHEISLSIFQICLSNGITIEAQWIPQSENLRTNFLSRNIDYEDLGITRAFFLFINNLSGPFDIDRFASFKYTKLDRFNSLFWNPGTELVD